MKPVTVLIDSEMISATPKLDITEFVERDVRSIASAVYYDDTAGGGTKVIPLTVVTEAPSGNQIQLTDVKEVTIGDGVTMAEDDLLGLLVEYKGENLRI